MNIVRQYLRRLSDKLKAQKIYAWQDRMTLDGLKPIQYFHVCMPDENALRSFLQEAFDILRAFEAGDRGPLDALVAGRKYFFIIGAPRTGGGFLKKTLHGILGELRTDDFIFNTDSIPRFRYLILSRHSDMRRQGLFEIIQWALWAKQRYPDEKFIVKKCIGFMYAMDVVYDVFRNTDAYYLVTLRHPASILASAYEGRIKHGRRKSIWEPLERERSPLFLPHEQPAWWSVESDNVRALYTWMYANNRIVDTAVADQLRRIRVVGYGDQPKFIQSLVEEVAPERAEAARQALDGDPFNLRQTKYEDFWYSDLTTAVIDSVKAHWRERGLDFPVDSRNIM